MRAWKPVRILLILILIAGFAAIGWNLHTRRSQPLPDNRTEMLSPDLARRSTAFEYSEYRRGQTVFRVWAETSVETLLGEHALTDVGLSFHDEEGNPSDSIKGKKATYDTQGKRIEFSGEVEIGLADGTRVFTDRLTADLDAEIIRIDEGFRFTREGVSGKGRELLYSLPDRRIEIRRGIYLNAADESGALEAQAEAAEHTLGGGTVALAGGARLHQGERVLQADEILFSMTAEDRIESIRASGKARLFPSAEDSFAGRRMFLAFGPDGQLSGFEVDGEAAGRAVYEETAQERRNRVESDRMIVAGIAAGNGRDVLIDSFEARGDVLFESNAAGLEEMRSDRLVARFSPGQELNSLDFSGNVRGRRESDGAVRESLSAESLHVLLGSGQAVERSVARGNVQLDQSAEGLTRRLRARESLEVNYEAGDISLIVSRGDSRLEIREGAEDRMEAWAPEIRVLFAEGKTERIRAAGGVRWRRQDGETVKDSTSRSLEISYKEGSMQEAVQTGDFRFRDQRAAGRVNLEAESAVYRPGEGTVTAESAENGASLRYLGRGETPEQALMTVAGRFIIEEETERITAVGQVRSIRNQNGEALVVNAGRMDADLESGWVWYSEEPTIVQQRGTIAGERVGFGSSEQELIVEGRVRSRFGNGGEAGQYRVASDRLQYAGDAARARYEGDVVLESRDLRLEAPFVELIFEPEDQSRLREVAAWGGVRIEQQGHKASGERAVYYPDGERIVLTGSNGSGASGGRRASPLADGSSMETKKETGRQ
jgi:lipopolysaccharide export system protein LptA